MKLKVKQLRAMIQETAENALKGFSSYDPSNYDERGVARVTPEEKKARTEGRKQAREKLAGKSVEQLKASYLKIERQAEAAYQDPVKSAFLWGALDQIKAMLKQQSTELPAKPRDPWIY